MANKSSAKEIITATFTALNVSGLTSLLGTTAVKNAIPLNPAYPYVRLESPTGSRWDTFQKAGKERFVFVHVFSQYRGDLEAIDIIDKVIDLLHYIGHSVSGHDLARYQYDGDFDGADEVLQGKMTLHKIVRFKVNVQES